MEGDGAGRLGVRPPRPAPPIGRRFERRYNPVRRRPAPDAIPGDRLFQRPGTAGVCPPHPFARVHDGGVSRPTRDAGDEATDALRRVLIAIEDGELGVLTALDSLPSVASKGQWQPWRRSVGEGRRLGRWAGDLPSEPKHHDGEDSAKGRTDDQRHHGPRG
jgi:hypothetical protein